VPRLQYPDDEVGQVGMALNTLQRPRSSPVRQADVRKASPTSSSTSPPQSGAAAPSAHLLDAMERRTENSDSWPIFRLDHMTTRMRGNAEVCHPLGPPLPAVAQNLSS